MGRQKFQLREPQANAARVKIRGVLAALLGLFLLVQGALAGSASAQDGLPLPAKQSAAAKQAAAADDDLATPGPYQVEKKTLRLKVQGLSSSVDVLLPDEPGPRPVVVVLHGWGGSPTDHSPLAEHLASRGFAVVLGGHPMLDLDPDFWAKQVKSNLDALETENANPKSPIAGRLDMNAIGVVGHSLGGATAIALAAQDPRVKATIALAPGTEILRRPQLLERASNVSSPLLVVSGAHDMTAMSELFGKPAFQASPAKNRLFVELAGANHQNFASAPWWQSWLNVMDLPDWLRGPSALGSSAQLEVTRRYATAWLSRFLTNAPDPQGLTDGRAARADESRGLVSQVLTGEKTARESSALPAGLSKKLRARDAQVEGADKDALGIADKLGDEMREKTAPERAR